MKYKLKDQLGPIMKAHTERQKQETRLLLTILISELALVFITVIFPKYSFIGAIIVASLSTIALVAFCLHEDKYDK